jgi:glycosyltransferase involved in cell wall biosynthesis
MRKLHVIPPPVTLPRFEGGNRGFPENNNPANHRPVIGMSARLATEKGVEVLLRSHAAACWRSIPTRWCCMPVNIRISWVKSSIGNGYRQPSASMKNRATGNFWEISILVEMAKFYPNLDVLVLPSLNSTEAFGLVQIEAMMNRVPSVASNLPGVRQPVKGASDGEDHSDRRFRCAGRCAAGDPGRTLNRSSADPQANRHSDIYRRRLPSNTKSCSQNFRKRLNGS